MSYKLELTEEKSSTKLIIPLQFNHKSSSSNITLFDDKKYSFKLYCDDAPIDMDVLYINGEKYEVQDLHTRECPSFEGYFGWIQIGILTNSQNLVSPFIQVDTYDANTYNSVKRMIQYISSRVESDAWHSLDYLGIDDKYRHNNFTTQSLLHGIIKCYEENYKHFFTNSRIKITDKKMVDSFEKLKHISSETIKYISTHPEQLIRQKDLFGIKWQGESFVPRKTLIDTNGYSMDVYENQIVLGFLRYLLEWLRKRETAQENNFFCFEDCFYEAQTKEEKLSSEDIKTLTKRIETLYKKYKRIFGKIQNIKITSLPPKTHAFNNIMHYKKIYKYIKFWFSGGSINIAEKDSVMWKLMTSSKIYEYYVLLKLDEKIKGDKFVFLEAESEFPNLLCYKKGTEKKYLYYEPEIIFEESKIDDKGIHLRRNTATSISGINSNAPYKPDYIIKSIDKNDNESYEVVDAKFSSFSTVRDVHRPKVAFKYLLSVHAINEEKAKIEGLKLYYCKEKNMNKDWLDPTIRDPYIKIIALL